ncbi:hypothetical protein TNCV_1693701 [Trichonephila clavipes]|nr:hypothetical protein TNCV_1693701 [Trichonephila clavipes]
MFLASIFICSQLVRCGVPGRSHLEVNQEGRSLREALKELKAILKWRNQHAGTVHRNSGRVNSRQSVKILKIRGYSSEELDTLVIRPNDTLNPLRTYQQVVEFTQDKLAIRTLNCQRAHQTDFDDVIS